MGRAQKGVIVVFGGFLIHLVLGTLYMWGNINVYVRSYFCYVQGETCETCTLSMGTVGIVFPLIFQALSIMTIFSVPMANLIGKRTHSLLASVILCGSLFASSYVTNFWLFSTLYGFIFGLCSGMIYFVPFNLGHIYFPNNKGIVSGIISSGFGLGSLIFSTIMLEFINPNNEPTVLPSCFPKNIADNLPVTIRWLSLMYTCCMLIGSFLMLSPTNMDLEQIKEVQESLIQQPIAKKNTQNDGECPNIKTALKQPKLYIAMIHTCLLAGIGVLIASNYKPYGFLFKNLDDDKFLTWVGNAGSIMNFCSRIIWGFVMDVLDFRWLAIILGLMQTAIIATITLATEYKSMYMVWIVLSFGVYGGLYAIMPTLASKVFGRKVGLTVIGVIFQGFALASWIQYFVVKYGVSKNLDDQASDYNNIFHYYICVPLIAILLAIIIPYKIIWNKNSQIEYKEFDSQEDEFEQSEKNSFQYRKSLEYRNDKSQLLNGGSNGNMEPARLSKKQDKVLRDSSYISKEGGPVGNNYPGYKR